MAFEGGPLSVIGITPSFVTETATGAVASLAQQSVGQVWQGAGQSFFGSAAQSLAGNLAGSAVNVALNSVLGTQVAGPQGLSLTSGANLLASTVTPYVTSALAGGINQTIQKSLQSAGPFGPALSAIGTGLVNQAFGGITNAIFGAAGAGGLSADGTNYKMFPGGGGEPSADYGGNASTLTDVVFSLQPANQGPQAFGESQGISSPTSTTTLPFNDLTDMPTTAGNPVVNTIKEEAMVAPPPNTSVNSFSSPVNAVKSTRTPEEADRDWGLVRGQAI